MRRSALVALALSAACAGPGPRGNPDSRVWRFLAERYDADRDGRVTRAEYPRSERGFRNLDASGDGVVSVLDFDASFDTTLRGPWKSFDQFAREYSLGGPAEGDLAPPIRLMTTDGAEVDLASFRGLQPVALVFGSFT